MDDITRQVVYWPKRLLAIASGCVFDLLRKGVKTGVLYRPASRCTDCTSVCSGLWLRVCFCIKLDGNAALKRTELASNK